MRIHEFIGRTNDGLDSAWRRMCNSLMCKEVSYLSILPAIFPSHQLYVSNITKFPEYFRNAHEEFTKRTASRMNQFRIRRKISVIIGVWQEKSREKVNFGG